MPEIKKTKTANTVLTKVATDPMAPAEVVNKALFANVLKKHVTNYMSNLKTH